MKCGCKSQPVSVKFFGVMLLAAAAIFCTGAWAAEIKGSGLEGFCGFAAGEMRKDRKIGDDAMIEVKPKTRFRKFERIGLHYTKTGRLDAIDAIEKISGKNHSAAKKEFEELVKWFQQAGVRTDTGFIRSNQGLLDTGWSKDNTAGTWKGSGAVKTKDSHLRVDVDIVVNYTDPNWVKEAYSGDPNIKKIPTGWVVKIHMEWWNVDKLDLTPGATPKRTNRKTPVKAFVEQTFHARFTSAFPADYYQGMMEDRRTRGDQSWTGWKDEDGDAFSAVFIVGLSKPPRNDVISLSAPVHVPGARWEYSRYLTKPICHAETVTFAYSNPKDQPGVKAPVSCAEDLALSAIVLSGRKEVKDGTRAASQFCGSVKSWLGIEFSETNITEKSTSMTFHDGDFTVMARTFVNSKSGRIELEYYVAISDVPMNSPEQLPLPNGNVASGSGGGGVKEGLEGVMSAWMTDCGEALKAARASGKLLLVYNIPRSSLKHKAFPSDPEFLSYATNRYVLLTVDGWGEAEKSEFPWAYSSGWPACRILDPEAVLLTQDGSRKKGWALGTSDYFSAKGGQMLELLKGFDKSRLVMPGALPKNREEPSLAELSKLHNALSQLPESFVNTYYLNWAERLVAADPDGSKGYRVCYPYAAKVYPRIKELVNLEHNYYSALYDLERKRIKDARDEQDGRYRGKNLRDIVAGELAEEWEPKFVDAISQLDKMDEEVPDGDSRFRFDNFKRDVGSVLNKLREARKASN